MFNFLSFSHTVFLCYLKSTCLEHKKHSHSSCARLKKLTKCYDISLFQNSVTAWSIRLRIQQSRRPLCMRHLHILFLFRRSKFGFCCHSTAGSTGRVFFSAAPYLSGGEIREVLIYPAEAYGIFLRKFKNWIPSLPLSLSYLVLSPKSLQSPNALHWTRTRSVRIMMLSGRIRAS